MTDSPKLTIATEPSPKLTAALAALVDCIKATIDSESPGRFAVAARMCQNAHALVREASTRVEDFDGDDEEVGMGFLHNPYRPGRLRRPRPLMGEGDVMREVMATALPLIERQGNSQQASVEESEAQTLATLLDVRAKVPAAHTAAVDARVEALLINIAERNKNDAVVPAGVLRGHQVGEQGGGLPADPGAADAEGAEGREGPTRTSAAQQVGHGG